MYHVVDTTTHVPVSWQSYPSRQEAKVERDHLNGEDGTRYIVSRGPNHPRGTTFGVDNTRREW